MNVFGKLVLDKFLPEVHKFHDEKQKRVNEDRVRKFLEHGMS